MGIGTAWGAKTTYTFSSKSWAASPANWTSGKDGNALTSGQGIQVTTGTSGANGTSPASFTNISKIEVQYCTNSKSGKGTIKVQVGSGTEKSFSVTAPSSGGTTLKTATFSFSPKETGQVKVTGLCTTNSVYIYSVTIYYETSITLNNNYGSSSSSNGSAKYNHEATTYNTFTAVTRDGYNCTGYWTASSGGTKILNADGTFANANITVSTTPYISSGKWAYTGATLTLYAQWEAVASCSDPATALSITSANTATVGTPLSLTSSGGNGETVTWSVTNGTGTATVVGSTLTPTGAGTVTVKATQPDGATYCGDEVAQMVTISLPNYTVTYNAGSGTCATSSFTQTAGVRSTTLPTATPPATCTGWSFAGWCTSSAGSADDNTTSPGSILTGSYTPTGNVTLYAVYTKAGEGGGGATLTKMVAGNTLANGDKIVVVANGTNIAMYQETTSTSYVQTWDCSTLNATTVGADDKNWWDVTATTGGYYLGDADNGYLNMSSNNLYCNSTQSVWTLYDIEDGTFKLQSNSRNLSYRSDLSTSKWRMGGASYGTSGNTILDIYKYSPSGGSTTYYMTSLVCCTPLGTINGSFFGP